LSEAHISSHNTLSAEGGTATYLRDPASSEPGKAGGATIETTGLLMIDLGNWAGLEALERLKNTDPPAPVCEAPAGEVSVLEFEADAYAVTEKPEERTPIRVTRSGSTVGAVSARVRMIGASAV